jgi:hypothetical protein
MYKDMYIFKGNKITENDKFFAINAKKWGKNRVPDVITNKLVTPYMSF